MFEDYISEWETEIAGSLVQSKSLCIAIYSANRKLIFCNEVFRSILSADPCQSLINPTFEKILGFKSETSLVFSGYLTIGDLNAVNTSISANIFRKQDKFMIIGGADLAVLNEQNKTLHQLNREINNLQREVLRKNKQLKKNLENLNAANEELKTSFEAIRTLNEDLQLTNNNLHEANATKDKFFSIIAHDLKNPFNSLLGFSEILMEDTASHTPEEIQQFAQIMNTASKQAFSLLENLLEWARLQTGRIKTNPVKIKASAIIDEIFRLCEPAAISKNIRFEIPDSADHIIWADKEMTKATLRNLVTNALKFTHSGGTVTIETQRSDNEVVFIVSDTGIGIESGYINSLFSIDSRLSRPGTADEKGTGLGLMLCKEFTEKNNGRIWVESEAGKGSAFKFTLPLHNQA